MKKITILTILFIFILSFSASCFATYYSVGIGSGGEDKGESLSLEIGIKDIEFEKNRYLAGKRLLTGIGILAIDYGKKNIPPGTFNFPCPHNDFTNLGSKTEGIESGLFGKIGMELFNSDVYVSIIEGITSGHVINIARSNPTGEFYLQSKSRKWYWIYGMSIGYFPQIFDWKLKLNFQIDYDNRRGLTGSIGLAW
jgi:hypothetical protein